MGGGGGREGGGRGRGAERGGEGETGSSKGELEGAEIGWLMFYDTWSRLIYAVSSIMGSGGGVGGVGEEAVSCIMGRQGVAREIQGGANGRLVDIV